MLVITAFDLTDEDEDTTVTSAHELEEALRSHLPRVTALDGPVPSAAYLERIAARPGVPYIDWDHARTIGIGPGPTLGTASHDGA